MSNSGYVRSLTGGATYYISVKAKNGAGTWSAVGSSNGIKLDATSPTTPVVIDDGVYTISAAQLHASWSASDPESGIAQYQFAIGTAKGGTDTANWVQIGTATSTTYVGLSLLSGKTYYFSVQAKSGAGVWSDLGYSDGIKVDTTPPTVTVVADDGVYTSSATQLHASWSSSDPESGIAEYQYAIGTAKNGIDIAGWTSAGTDTSVTKTGLALVLGKTYYFSVKAKNGAGSWSYGYSDGIRLDTTIPTGVPVVTDDGIYTTSKSQISLYWTKPCADNESGIVEYQYAVGTSKGAANIFDWGSLGMGNGPAACCFTLTNGATYYFSVRAKNGAGLYSVAGNSDGIKVDATAPLTPVVTDDGAYTTNAIQLHARWASSDSESGIAEYQYAIGTTRGGTNVVGWTSTGTGTSVTKTGLSLKNGATCYFTVKAKNCAGTWSIAGNSDGIKVDTTIPIGILIVTDDGTYTTSTGWLHASWTQSCVDPESSIAEYQYAIGTTRGGTNTLGWTSASLSGLVTANAALINGATYYFSVRAKNGAGLYSVAGNSNGIKVDAVAPLTPMVTDDGAYTTSKTQLHARWTSSDPESGIAEYQYAIGATRGGTNVVDWTSTGTGTSVTKTGLSLKNGAAYYFTVKAKNGAGLWSSAGYLDGIKVQ